MSYEFKLPDLGEGVREGEIARWLVEVGQEIAEDDPLVEIQTDKTTVEIPSPAAGKVAQILVEEGELVPVGTPLVLIGSDGEAPARAPEKVQATPLVRRIAEELGVDLSMVTGTGPGGRITEDDVRGTPGPAEGERRSPLRGIRRQIAEHLTRAHREVPSVTVVEECDFTALSQSRGERSYLPYVLTAAVEGLKAYPELNATLAGNEIIYWERYDIGLAVQTDEGLVVPVLRAADEKSLDELGAEARRALRHATRQPSGGRDSRPPPHRPPCRRRGRTGGGPQGRLALVHLRPSCGGRSASERVPSRGHRTSPVRLNAGPLRSGTAEGAEPEAR
jgi:pyruvate/2-oxoglutarate dehydrogenase complex dihydrolipoamide acyltransferase (E2) component